MAIVSPPPPPIVSPPPPVTLSPPPPPGAGGGTQVGAGDFTPNILDDIAKELGLPPPSQMADDDLIALLQSLRAKTEDEQMKSSGEAIRNAKEAKAAAADEKIKALKEQIEKMDKAEKGGVFGKIFGWIAAAAMVIAGAALLIAGGAGAALLIGGIAMMAVMTMQETGAMDKMINGIADGLAKMGMDPKVAQIIATVIATTLVAAVAVAASIAGGPAVGASVFMMLAPTLFSPENLQKMGVPEDAAPWVSFGISIGCSLAAAGIGIGSALKGTAEAGSKLTQLGAKLSQVLAEKASVSVEQLTMASQRLAYVAMGIQAVSTIGGGASGITVAVTSKEASDAGAKAKEMEALFLKLQQVMQEEGERIEEIIKRLQEGADIVTEVMHQSDATASRIATI
jgi:hypothetical protein